MVRVKRSGTPRLWARVARATVAMAAAGLVALAIAAPAASAVEIDPPGPLPPVTTPTLPAGLEDPVAGLIEGGSPTVAGAAGTLGGLLGTATNPLPATAPTPAETPAVATPAAQVSAAPSLAADAETVESTSAADRGEIRQSGSAAVLRLARSATALLVLVLAAGVFLAMQPSTERRNPRLIAAPIDAREVELEFR
jgi:hypothetical protein